LAYSKTESGVGELSRIELAGCVALVWSFVLEHGRRDGVATPLAQ
jgi:hypothetical protein